MLNSLDQKIRAHYGLGEAIDSAGASKDEKKSDEAAGGEDQAKSKAAKAKS